MKDLSFLLLHNYFAAKMRKGIKTFCTNADCSTSTTFNHHHHQPQGPSPTLEEMILQLELEEELARKAKLEEQATRRRMSCVNSSDILQSARNALNQYPRFSLDGRDSMYRASFRNLEDVKEPGRKSVCCDHGLTARFGRNGNDHFGSKLDRSLSLTQTLAGESVVWCKPGVVAKLMGLEAIPVPIGSSKEGKDKRSSSVIKRQNLRRRAERHEIERRLAMNTSTSRGGIRGENMGSCSKARYRMMNPVAVDPSNAPGGWPTRRFY